MEPNTAPSRGDRPDCQDCRAALESGGRQAISFLLVETLTVPVVGCDAHLEEFRAICELTTEDSAELLGHLPAGGIQCPACRNHEQGGGMPLIFVEAGAVGVLACERHATAVIECYQSGLQARQQLGANGPRGGGSIHNTGEIELPDLDDS
jgi:hypothetical protein